VEKINAYRFGADRKKDGRIILALFLAITLFGILYQLSIGWYLPYGYVTTLLSFSYLKNGFCRRGLIGTIFDLVSRVFPSIYCYKGAYWFMFGMTVCFLASLLAFTVWALRKIKDSRVYNGAVFFSLVCFTFLIPTTFYNDGAFGRADLMQMILCLLQVYLLVEMKHEWLTVPLTAVNTLFHEGYVLMTFCTVLIVLIYREVNPDGKKKNYWIILGANLIICAVVAVLSLKAGSAGNDETYFAAFENAKSLNKSGYVHRNLLAMMVGYYPDSSYLTDDSIYVIEGIKEIPFFIATFIPVFMLFGRGVFHMFKAAKGKKIGLYIAAILLGPALIGVEYAKYCDYGRYIFWLAFYYFVMQLSFAAMDDGAAKEALGSAFAFSNTSMIIILIGMMIYEPLPSCSFTNISSILKLYYIG